MQETDKHGAPSHQQSQQSSRSSDSHLVYGCLYLLGGAAILGILAYFFNDILLKYPFTCIAVAYAGATVIKLLLDKSRKH